MEPNHKSSYFLQLNSEEDYNLLKSKIQGSYFCKHDFDRGIDHALASMSHYHYFDYLLFQEAKVGGGKRQGGTFNDY